MQYKILNSSDCKELENGVNFHLKEGWEIHGNLNTIVWNYNGSDFIEFYQPMVKNEKKISMKPSTSKKAF